MPLNLHQAAINHTSVQSSSNGPSKASIVFTKLSSGSMDVQIVNSPTRISEDELDIIGVMYQDLRKAEMLRDTNLDMPLTQFYLMHESFEKEKAATNV